MQSARGRALLKAAAYQPPHEPRDDDYPLRLTTGRTVHHWHTRTRTARSPELQDAAPGMWVELHPEDASPLRIEEGDTVTVSSRHGRIEAPVRLSGPRPGVVFAPFHYGYFDRRPVDDAPAPHTRAANELTPTQWDPVSKQPLYKVTAVRVSKSSEEEKPSEEEKTSDEGAPPPHSTATEGSEG
ncbi:molybdopterin oxidoreductase family protein [Streptomyces purpurogeneiscleroticus]|uniref:molybdopterin oxidoreductase family protein n=1 Tax=Streptomyces purpurogeneiscleroticus TaxID=68259 RepID=UPI001CBE065B|nr:molybdopterin dinucleotide binding domain-containing protein [Streptomyces purpurogeneiscleroticus]